MIRPKYPNNIQSYDLSDNSITQKKEEKPNSIISVIDPILQPTICKSGFSNKK